MLYFKEKKYIIILKPFCFINRKEKGKASVVKGVQNA
jgi:hypothetical protein